MLKYSVSGIIRNYRAPPIEISLTQQEEQSDKLTSDGKKVAMESADIVLMRSDLMDVPTAIQLSKSTIRNIKQNLFWAFGYNVAGIPIAAGVLYVLGGPLLNPVFAAAAMSLSSVSVLTNALRLKRFKTYK